MQSSSSAYDVSADDGLDLLRSMIAEEHGDDGQPQPPVRAHQHVSTLTIDNMSELLRATSRRRSLTQDDDDDDEVDMLKGITDADDGGSLASYNNNPDGIIHNTTCARHDDGEEDDDQMASPPSSPNRNAGRARRGTHRQTNYDSLQMQQMQMQTQMHYQRGPPMSPMKQSRELQGDGNASDDIMPSDGRSYLHRHANANASSNARANLQPPWENVMAVHAVLEGEQQLQQQQPRKQEQERPIDGQNNIMYSDTSFMRRTSSVGSNTTSKAGNVTSSSTGGSEYTHRDKPLHHDVDIDIDAEADAEADDGHEDKAESSSTISDNCSRRKISSQESSRPRSSASASSTSSISSKPTTGVHNARSKTYPPSSSSAPRSQTANPPPSQRPLLAVGLPPPPPPHLIEQVQTQAKSQAFHMMAVQHLPAHIQAEAAAAAQAAVAIVAARAGVTVPSTSSMPTPTATVGAQPPQLPPQQMQMFQQQFLQMQPNASNDDPPSQGPKIDYAAAGEAVAAAATATASKATERRAQQNTSDLPQVVTTNASTSPLASPNTSDKRIKQNVIPKTATKNPTKKEPSAHVDTAMTPPTMPNTPLTATAALSSGTLDVDASSAPAHYFSVSDRDDQSVSSAYSTSSRGSGTVSCSSNACRGPMRRRVISASSMSTSSGGKPKQQQAKKTPRQVKKRGGAASPKGSARSRQPSSSSSYRGGPSRSMQRARSYTAPGSINGSNGFGIQIPPVPMGPLSPLPSPTIGSPLPDVRSMRVTSPPRASLSPTPSSAERPRNRASTAPLVRHHSYPATTNDKTSSKSPPATPVPPHFFHPAVMTGISPPAAMTVEATSETPAPYSSTTPATPANPWLGQLPSSLLPGGGVSPVPFFIPPFPIAGMPMMSAGQLQPNQHQATIQCWCGGSYPAGNKEAEAEHAATKQHKHWVARSQAEFYKMQNSASR